MRIEKERSVATYLGRRAAINGIVTFFFVYRSGLLSSFLHQLVLVLSLLADGGMVICPSHLCFRSVLILHVVITWGELHEYDLNGKIVASAFWLTTYCCICLLREYVSWFLLVGCEVEAGDGEVTTAGNQDVFVGGVLCVLGDSDGVLTTVLRTEREAKR